jgi:hypothetical protein
MWTRILSRHDRAFVSAQGKERWQNANVDEFMAHRLGEPTPGPDGAKLGWRIWEDTVSNRLLCEHDDGVLARLSAATEHEGLDRAG